jgi:beta-glucosidase
VLTNTGKMAGEEVVQLYIRDLQGSIVRPVKELKGFRKQALAPGESSVIEFMLTSNDLAFYNVDNVFKAEPGDFHLFIGPDSENLKLAKFSLME